MTVMGMAWPTPEPDASPADVVKALRAQAASVTVFADALADSDSAGAAALHDEALRLRCQAAVIDGLSELYDELGMQARACSDFAMSLRRLA